MVYCVWWEVVFDSVKRKREKREVRNGHSELLSTGRNEEDGEGHDLRTEEPGGESQKTPREVRQRLHFAFSGSPRGEQQSPSFYPHCIVLCLQGLVYLHNIMTLLSSPYWLSSREPKHLTHLKNITDRNCGKQSSLGANDYTECWRRNCTISPVVSGRKIAKVLYELSLLTDFRYRMTSYLGKWVNKD
jgi:hypothetical protein